MDIPCIYLVPISDMGISSTDLTILRSKLRGQVRFDGIAGASAVYGVRSVFANKDKPKIPTIMKCVELNPSGNFDSWEPSKILELQRKKIDDRLGQKLLFENDKIKVWEVVLFPGERLPFRKINGNYSFTSMTEGLAISRYATGKINLVRIKKGDSMFIKHEGQAAIYDFENIGENILFLHVMEFKPLIVKIDGLKIESDI